MRWLFVVLLLAGCGRIGFDPQTSDGPSPDRQSGTRLKLEDYDFGTFRVSGDYFFDAERGEECFPERMTDGTYRCTPRGEAAPNSVYRDASCTTPLALAVATCEGTQYMHIRDGATCGNPIRLYATTQVPDTSIFQRAPDGSCFGPVPTSGETAVTLDREVLPGELVEMIPVRQPVSARLDRIVWTTADGLRAPARGMYFDRTLQTVCIGTYGQQSTTLPDPGICRPDHVVLDATYFGDASCSIPVAFDAENCPAPKFGDVFDTCRRDVIYEANPVVPPIYSMISNACTEVSGAEGTYVRFGNPVDTMPATYSLPADPSRIVRLVQSIDGMVVGEGELFDRTLDTACFLNDDGTCIPSVMRVRDVYADAACSSPVSVFQDAAQPECNRGTPRYASRPTGCHTDVYALTGERTAPFYTPTAGCTQVNPPSPIVTYDLGAQVTDLVRATTRVVP